MSSLDRDSGDVYTLFLMRHPINLERDATFRKLSALCLAVFFFASGNFGLVNILGIRREVQAALLVPLFIAFLLTAPTWRWTIWNPVFILSVVLVTREVFEGVQFVDFGNALAMALAVQLIIGNTARFQAAVVKWSVLFAALFSLMGLVESVIIFFQPDIILHTNRPYTSGMGAASVAIIHPIQYLGFNASGEEVYLFGRPYTRFNSFASEPSVLVATLLIPAYFGLMIGREYRLLGIVILLFVIGPVQSGTIWLSCLCAVCIYVYLKTVRKLFRRIQRLAAPIAMSVLLGIIVLMQKLDIAYVRDNFTKFGIDFLSVTSTLASKGEAITFRLGGMKEAFLWVVTHPLGSLAGPAAAGLGLMLSIGYLAGYTGIGFCVWMYIRIFQKMTAAFATAESEWVKMGICGCGGALFQAFFFSGFGWITPAGFTVFALLVGIAGKKTWLADGRPLKRHRLAERWRRLRPRRRICGRCIIR